MGQRQSQRDENGWGLDGRATVPGPSSARPFSTGVVRLSKPARTLIKDVKLGTGDTHIQLPLPVTADLLI